MFSFAIHHFRRPPSDMQLEYIAYNSAAGWRSVIEAVREAFPMSRMKVIEFGALTASPAQQLAAVSGWRGVATLETKHRVINRSKPIEDLAEVLAARGDSLGLARLAGKGRGRKLTLFSASGVDLLRQAYDSDLAWLRHQTDARLSFLAAPKQASARNSDH